MSFADPIHVIYTDTISGVQYPLKTTGLRIRTANFHTYEWDRDVTERNAGETVNRFFRPAIEYETELVFMGRRGDVREQLYAMHASWERAILEQTPGRLSWGSAYIPCYITASDTHPDENWDQNLWTVNEIIIYCPNPFWIEESSYQIPALVKDGTYHSHIKGYNYQYSYGYDETFANDCEIYIDHYTTSNFVLTAYGPFAELYVEMGGNVYNIKYPAARGERIIIDSRSTAGPYRRAYIRRSDGTTQSVFNYRNQDFSIFEKLPYGNVKIEYARTYDLALTVYKERSEPRW